jgi:HK97 family phage major capsid protein
MEIQDFVKATTAIPLGELTAVAAHRGAFGDDVLAAFATQVQLRSTAAQTVLDAASQANRDTLLASEQRSYDAAIRERDAILGLQRSVEQRTETRAFVPATQGSTPAKPKRGLFGIELRALVESGGGGQIITPDQWGPGFFDRLVPESAALNSGIRVIRTDRDTIHIPHITADPAAAWTAEGTPITATDPNYVDQTANPKKLATLTQLSNEVIADSNPDVIALLEMQVARSLALKFDLGVFEGSGVAPEIRGLKNIAGITTDTSLTAKPVNLDVFANAIATLESNNAKATTIVMHPRTWGTLLALKETSTSNKALLQMSAGSASQGVVRALYGVPVYLSSQLSTTEPAGTASSAYVYDNTQVIAVFRQDTQIQLDRSRLFNSDQSELRAILRADVIVPNPLAVVRIAGFVTT